LDTPETPEKGSSDKATRIELARTYFDQRRWRELWQLKQQAKYSWTALGLTKAEAERAKINKPDWL
jgi:hypothetical protein